MVKIPLWFNKKPPIYDISKSYLENALNGPFFDKKLLLKKTIDPNKWIDFLGYKIQSPLGVAAGPLLNSKYISLASQLGFDVLTYKTIRTHMHPAHPTPNMIFVEMKSSNIARKKENPPQKLSELTLTNSFGMPSFSSDYLLEDIKRANNKLSKGQVMIVSVVGNGEDLPALIKDFITAACLAKDAGAKIIEANFSCPNVKDSSAQLYLDAEGVYKVASAVVKAIKPIPLIIKVGIFPSSAAMEKVMTKAAYANVQGICGINSISRTVLDKHDNYALGKLRPTSGICGSQIKKYAWQFVKNAHLINEQKKLGLTLLACGGATLPKHLSKFLSLKADIAMSATAMMWDPYLALRWKKKNGYL